MYILLHYQMHHRVSAQNKAPSTEFPVLVDLVESWGFPRCRRQDEQSQYETKSL